MFLFGLGGFLWGTHIPQAYKGQTAEEWSSQNAVLAAMYDSVSMSDIVKKCDTLAKKAMAKGRSADDIVKNIAFCTDPRPSPTPQIVYQYKTNTAYVPPQNNIQLPWYCGQIIEAWEAQGYNANQMMKRDHPECTY